MHPLHRVILLALMVAVPCLGTGCSKATRIARHLERANRYYDAQDHDRALVEYLNVVRLDPTRPVAVVRLGLIFFEKGDAANAYSLLSRGVELEPRNQEARLRLGLLCLSAGRAKEAWQQALEVLNQDPTQDEALILLADAATGPKEIQDTVEVLDRVRAPAEHRAGYHLARGKLAAQQRDLAGAEASFERALAIAPRMAQVHLALAHLRWLQGRLDEADRCFKQAATLASRRSDVRYRWVDFKLRTGAPEEAKQILDTIARDSPDQATALNYLAEIQLRQGKFEDCAATLKRVRAQTPRNYITLVLQARLALARGQAGDALQQLESLRTTHPRVADVHYQIALAHLANNDLGKAMASLNQALALQPRYVEAALALAGLQIRRGDTVSALALLNPIVKDQPGLVPAQLLMADAYRAAGNRDEALAIYRKLGQAAPQAPQPSFLSGLVYREQGKTAEARRAFEQALILDPDSYLVQEQLAQLDLAERKLIEARQRLEAAVQRNPKEAWPWLLRARLDVAQTNLTAAAQALTRAIELQPEFREGYLLLAQVYVASHQHPQALARLEEVLRRNPRDVSALMQVGVIQEYLQKWPEARQAYERLLAVNPRFGPALNNLAYLYLQQFNEVDKAYELARQAKELAPYNPNVTDTLGWLLYRRGDYARAVAHLRESAEKLPGDPEVLYHLGAAHYMLGEEASARPALDRALALRPEFPGRPDAEALIEVLKLEGDSPSPAVVERLEKRVREVPQDPVAALRLARAYESRGAPAKAKDILEAAVRANPNATSLRLSLATLYYERLHNPGRALELAKEARSAAPQDPHVAHALGRLTFETGDHAWALALLQPAASRLRENPECLYDLALAQYSVGRVGEAETSLGQALQLDPAFPQARAARQWLEFLGMARDPARLESGGSRVEAALREDPKHVPALMVRGLSLERNGRSAEARQTYLAALGVYPQFTPALKQAVLLASSQATNDRADLDLGAKGRELMPDDVAVAKAAGLIAFRQRDYPRSAQWLGEAALKLPGDAEARYYLGLAQRGMKQDRDAAKTLQQALAMNLQPDLAREARRVLAEIR